MLADAFNDGDGFVESNLMHRIGEDLPIVAHIIVEISVLTRWLV